MKRVLIFSLALFFAVSCFAADLQSDLQKMASAYTGKVAVFAKNLKTGQTVAIDADTPVATASVIKMPIMLEAFYQAKAGKLDLAKRLTVTKDDQVPGSGVLAYIDPDVELSLKDAITLMMIVSDNTAANLSMDQVGIANVDARLAAMGLKSTYLYKKVFKPATGPMPPDQPKFGLGKTTAREMAEVMESIQRCDLKDQALCDTMIKIMRGQQDHDMIPRYIGTDKDVAHPQWIADKIGALNDVRNDVALVQMKDGPALIISIFTWDNQDKRWTPENAAEILIASMAKRIVQEWGGTSATAQPADPPLEFLLAAAAADFHAHGPSVSRFRNVRMGHVSAADGSKQYMLCGEFLPAKEEGKAEWTSFVTIKTSGYEQWLGAQAANLCQRSGVVWDKGEDLSSSLQSRFDSLR